MNFKERLGLLSYLEYSTLKVKRILLHLFSPLKVEVHAGNKTLNS